MKKALAQFIRLTTIAFQTAAPNAFLSQRGSRLYGLTVTLEKMKMEVNLVLLDQRSKLKMIAEMPLSGLQLPNAHLVTLLNAIIPIIVTVSLGTG